MCWGGKRKPETEGPRRISSFTIKDSYLSYIFKCYLIESIVSLYNIPALQKSVIKYQLYTLLKGEDNEDSFTEFKNHMIVLYCAIHNMSDNAYYLYSLEELISNNTKIFQHFIQSKLKINDLSDLLNRYYFNNNITALSPLQQKIRKTYFIHKFMLNHVVSKEITNSPEDKRHIIENLRIGNLPGARIAKLREILTQFINSLSNEEMKIFVSAITGSTSKPEYIQITFDQYNEINELYQSYKFSTCFKSLHIRHNYSGKAQIMTVVPSYNATESIIYDFLITQKTISFDLIRSTITHAGFSDN